MNIHLLAFEDDPAIADIVVEVARSLDMKARSITNTEKFEIICQDARPDIVVLDILMPERDGFEVLAYLQEHHPHTRIIVLSGQDNYREMAEKVALGKGQHIVATMRKPFRVSDLRKTLQTVVDDFLSSNNQYIA